jgi:CheY-like chemotaxis protein
VGIAMGERQQPNAIPRILLVEDSESSRDMLRRRLARRGFDVLLADSAEAAVQATLGQRPDLILMDIHLGHSSGLDATQQIRAAGNGVRTPIIALTAHAFASDRQRCLAAGCDAFETKPIDFARLVGTIEQLLDKER